MGYELRLTRPTLRDEVISTHFGDGGHRGLDLAIPVGTPLFAPCDGLVVDFTNSWQLNPWTNERVKAFGEGVCIRHESGLHVLSAHMSAVLPLLGQQVAQEEPIGLSGNTGVSSGPHLHLQVCLDSRFSMNIADSRDPLAYWHPEDEMSPEDRQLLYKLAQAVTGTPGPMSLPILDFQLSQVAPGSSLLLGYKSLWNAAWNHMHEDGFSPSCHTQPPTWKEY